MLKKRVLILILTPTRAVYPLVSKKKSTHFKERTNTYVLVFDSFHRLWISVSMLPHVYKYLLRSCLVTSKIYFLKIFYHNESYGTCIKH